MPQKFLRGHRVKVADKLPRCMSHFQAGCEAIVLGSHADFFWHMGGLDEDSFSLLLLTEKPYECSWYNTDQLTLIDADRDKGEALLQEYRAKIHSRYKAEMEKEAAKYRY